MYYDYYILHFHCELLWCLCGWSEKLETGAIKVAEGGLWRNESAHTAAAQPEVMAGTRC